MISLARRSVGKSDRAQTVRGGVSWDLDLHEGIDFSIFLLGGFEARTLALYRSLLGRRDEEVAFDIGANIGSHTLPLAQLVVPRGGRVFAFEPTQFAYDKLVRNLALNPALAPGVDAIQAALARADDVAIESAIYSSWPLGHHPGLHSDHGGARKSTAGARAMSLDSFVAARGITRIDFIKLDVDGHEPDVLDGAWSSISGMRPTMLLEWAPHVFGQRAGDMRAAMVRFLGLGYRLLDGASGRPLSGGMEELDRRTPARGSMNVLLRVTAT